MAGAISFDFNFWTILFLSVNFMLAFFVMVSNRHKVKTDELNAVKSELSAKITKLAEGKSEMSERLASAEAKIQNAVDDQDLVAVHKRVDEIAAISKHVQGRLDEISVNLQPLNGNLQNLGQQLGVVQGMLTALIGAKDK